MRQLFCCSITYRVERKKIKQNHKITLKTSSSICRVRLSDSASGFLYSNRGRCSAAASPIAKKKKKKKKKKKHTKVNKQKNRTFTEGAYTKSKRAHTHRELIRELLWEPKGSSLEYI